MKNYLAIVFVIAVIAGCDNKNVPAPKTAAVPPAETPGNVQPIAVPPPAAPVGDAVPHPVPGEPNERSSPRFKAGGPPQLK